jgi:peptidoglycan hydrolase-like protein with peptidoglycan-binding domain
MPNTPIIPESITVHLGTPNSNAENVTLPFLDYITNVASSEIYPTWPESAIRANVYAQISFALNRVYTEFYRSRGYDFDITNSTAFDQAFVNGRDVFENVQQIVREIFTDYISRQGSVEPLFAQYCNGTTVTCNGLSQWGTVPLAEQGYTPYEILQYFYGDDININTNTPIGEAQSSAPPFPLSAGSSGDDVRTLQIRLNRISTNYPAIPKISNPNGVFSTQTEDSVRIFQQIFNLTPDGIVGKATWYKIQSIYNAVKKLNELESEGLSLSEVSKQFTGTLSEGDTGLEVSVVQYYLRVIAEFNPKIAEVTPNGVFDEETKNAVLAFQREYGLPETGEVNEETWNKLSSVYLGLIDSAESSGAGIAAEVFPGTLLNLGSSGEDVEILQTYLNTVAQVYTEIPTINVSGTFDAATENAVIIFQRIFGIPQSGVVGPITWEILAEKYAEIENGKLRAEFQYPGDITT